MRACLVRDVATLEGDCTVGEDFIDDDAEMLDQQVRENRSRRFQCGLPYIRCGGIFSGAAHMAQVEGQLAEGSECGVHHEQDAMVALGVTGIAIFDHDVGIGDELAAIGAADKAHVADKDVAGANLGEDCLGDMGRAGDPGCVGIDPQRDAARGLDPGCSRRQGPGNEIPAQLAVPIALPGIEEMNRLHRAALASSPGSIERSRYQRSTGWPIKPRRRRALGQDISERARRRFSRRRLALADRQVTRPVVPVLAAEGPVWQSVNNVHIAVHREEKLTQKRQIRAMIRISHRIASFAKALCGGSCFFFVTAVMNSAPVATLAPDVQPAPPPRSRARHRRSSRRWPGPRSGRARRNARA